MVLEALRAAEKLAEVGIEAEVIDVRSLRPLDSDLILSSVLKTGHVIVDDTAWTTGGFSGEIVALIAEKAFNSLKRAPQRLGLLDCPTPSSRALAKFCYPRAVDVVNMVGEVLGIPKENLIFPEELDQIP